MCSALLALSVGCREEVTTNLGAVPGLHELLPGGAGAGDPRPVGTRYWVSLDLSALEQPAVVAEVRALSASPGTRVKFYRPGTLDNGAPGLLLDEGMIENFGGQMPDLIPVEGLKVPVGEWTYVLISITPGVPGAWGVRGLNVVFTQGGAAGSQDFDQAYKGTATAGE